MRVRVVSWIELSSVYELIGREPVIRRFDSIRGGLVFVFAGICFAPLPSFFVFAFGVCAFRRVTLLTLFSFLLSFV